MRMINAVKALALRLSMSNYFPMKVRRALVRMGGVRFGNSFVGQQVIFDSTHPENIEIGDHCAITMRCVILTHFVKPAGNNHRYECGKVRMGNNVFLGAGTIITKPVTIGDNVIVGAGSVVTKDIPSNEIWVGAPAHFLKKY